VKSRAAPVPTPVVIAGLDPAIHSVALENGHGRHGMDARIKSGHDDNQGAKCFRKGIRRQQYCTAGFF
jgi:hypothetical protein